MGQPDKDVPSDELEERELPKFLFAPPRRNRGYCEAAKSTG